MNRKRYIKKIHNLGVQLAKHNGDHLRDADRRMKRIDWKESKKQGINSYADAWAQVVKILEPVNLPGVK